MAFLTEEPTTLRARLRAVTRTQWLFALGSVLLTFIVMFAFLIESRFGYAAPEPKLIYVESWPTSRTLAETRTDQAKALADARERAILLEKERQRRAKAMEGLMLP